ncbi:MAG: AAA family ATPase, partial [Rhizobiaceae bacterium]
MRIEKIAIRNFRRLENVEIGVEDRETVFVGPNNSGKTSATEIFRCFLGQRNFRMHDFSVSKIIDINEFGDGGPDAKLPAIELD